MLSDRDLLNHGATTARCVPMVDRHGRDALVVVAKLTLEVSAAGEVWRAREPSPIRLTDETILGGWSSLRFPGDLVDERPGTDVLLIGTAHPPPGERVSEVDVGLRVGRPGSALSAAALRLDKTVRVRGPRVWYAGAFGVVPGPPAALSPTPLVYENAYGGVDRSDPAHVATEPRNPVGTGFAVKRASLVGKPAPALEDPSSPLDGRAPAPAGFGPIPSHWEPRASRAGTHDEAWRRERAPYRPLDFDPRHDSSAPDDQHLGEPLAGNEIVEVRGATPRGAWLFRLPGYAPIFHARIEGERVDLDTHLDMVLVDADARRVELTWRASLPVPRKVSFIEHLSVDEHRRAPVTRPKGERLD